MLFSKLSLIFFPLESKDPINLMNLLFIAISFKYPQNHLVRVN
ncbi:MAG: hypothetical protein CM15mP122_2640 [Bacteroidota bacterium]|nr:MAG: hypothetical protein CM15mP122_2640 [Bacteroidota bacterium]